MQSGSPENGLPAIVSVVFLICNTGHFFSKIPTCTFAFPCATMIAEKGKLRFVGEPPRALRVWQIVLEFIE